MKQIETSFFQLNFTQRSLHVLLLAPIVFCVKSMFYGAFMRCIIINKNNKINVLVFTLLCMLMPMQSLLGDAIRKDYIEMNAEALRQAEREIYEKFGMRAFSARGEAITIIRKEGLEVETNVPFSIQEGRRLLITCIDILLKHVNAHRPLRPFLFEYPFPLERTRFAIAIHPEIEKTMPKDALLMCAYSDGTIRYYIPPERKDPLERMLLVHKETYQEALQILAKENKDLLLPKNPLSPEEVKRGLAEIDEEPSEASMFLKSAEVEYDFARSMAPYEEIDMSWELDKYATALAKKHNMEFHCVRGLSYKHDDIYSLMFISFQQINLQQGREFFRDLVKDFLSMLQTSPVIKKFIAYRNELYDDDKYQHLRIDEPVPEQMAVKISFWDKNFDRAKKPYLAEIVFLCGNFYYYQANPETQARELILKESFADAMAGEAK